MESWRQDSYREAGIADTFVQDNISLSGKGVLRGLHFQNPRGQGKLINVLQGEVFDVAVDIRVGSPTFGESFSVYLSSEKKNQLFVPPGFAHGFLTMSEQVLFSYKCTNYYNPSTEFSLLWNDPALNIDWPLDKLGEDPQLSEKDIKGIKLSDFCDADLPRYTPSQ